MDWLNPVEWVAWLYGKLFQNHVVVGGVIVAGLFALLGLLVWLKAVDKYREEHPLKRAEGNATSPKSQAVTSQAQTVTANSTPLPAPPTSSQKTAKKSTNHIQKTARIVNGATPGSMTFVDNHGENQRVKVDELTMKGSPAPGTNMTGIKIGPEAKGGNIQIGRVYMYAPSGPVPPPAAVGADFHLRISTLNKEASEWLANNPNGPAGAFHQRFGDQLELLAEQLRACDPQAAKYIYDREKDQIDDIELLKLSISDLLKIDRGLPQDETQIQCANK